MDKNRIRLGEEVMVSDPCYSMGTWCTAVLKDVLPGEYICSCSTADEGTRVKSIQVIHESCKKEIADTGWEAVDEEIGVDSGMAGIFDMDYYKEYHKKDLDEEWYDRVYDVTLQNIPNPKYKPITEREWVKEEYKEYEDSIKKLLFKAPAGIVISIVSVAAETSIFPSVKDELVRRLTEVCESLAATLPKEFQDPDWDAITDKIEELTEKFVTQYVRKMVPSTECWTDTREIKVSLDSTIDEKGYVSSAGYGDGGYECYVSKNEEGKIVAIKVIYIEDEEDEDE